MRELCASSVVMAVKVDQCAYGLVTTGPHGKAPAQKPRRSLTTPPCIASELTRQCHNRLTHTKIKHQHIPLMHGRARAAQEHPNQLCRALRRGIVKQIEADRQGRFMLATLHELSDQGATTQARRQIEEELKTGTEEDTLELINAWDDVSGAELEPNKVYEARMEEVGFIREM